jgi:hypothetical protein
VQGVKASVQQLRASVASSVRDTMADFALLGKHTGRLAADCEVAVRPFPPIVSAVSHGWLQAKRFRALYERESAVRRTLQSKLVAAGGNIRVFCRVRPRAADEVRTRVGLG